MARAVILCHVILKIKVPLRTIMYYMASILYEEEQNKEYAGVALLYSVSYAAYRFLK